LWEFKTAFVNEIDEELVGIGVEETRRPFGVRAGNLVVLDRVWCSRDRLVHCGSKGTAHGDFAEDVEEVESEGECYKLHATGMERWWSGKRRTRR